MQPASQQGPPTLARAEPAYQIFKGFKGLQMNDIRCGQCNRKLAEGTYLVLSIKCPRCGTVNHLRASTPSTHAVERPTLKDANVIFKNQSVE